LAYLNGKIVSIYDIFNKRSSSVGDLEEKQKEPEVKKEPKEVKKVGKVEMQDKDSNPIVSKLNEDELAYYDTIKKYQHYFKIKRRNDTLGGISLTDRALKLQKDDKSPSKSQDIQRRMNFIGNNIKNCGKQDKIQKVKMICRAIIKEQEIANAQSIRS